MDCVSVDSRARRGKMLQRTAVALLASVCKCWVSETLSLAQGINSALPNPSVQGVMDIKRVRDGGPALGK